jgi:hypothetical protein
MVVLVVEMRCLSGTAGNGGNGYRGSGGDMVVVVVRI